MPVFANVLMGDRCTCRDHPGRRVLIALVSSWSPHVKSFGSGFYRSVENSLSKVLSDTTTGPSARSQAVVYATPW